MDAVDLIPTVSCPSLIIGAPPAIKYDVFLSFRGEDTRHTFSSYLYEALDQAGLHTFMDHKLHKGDHISPILLKTIEKSEISLIIFSKDYASSTWCMDELVHIMKCKDKYGRLVVPIFYNVDPSNIRKQDGRFGDGFAKLKQRFKHDQKRVQEWKNDLIKSASLSGWDSENFRPESELVKKIVKDVLSKLNRRSSFHVDGLVGIDHQIQKVEELLTEARIVGIWGMGGIGKTTLARAVFERLTADFESFYFVEDVKQKLAKNRSKYIKECLKKLLHDDDINPYNLTYASVRRRLEQKKILLVLDDVDNSRMAEDLIKACDWFGEGSRIIITSRDMQVLKNASDSASPATYHVLELNPHDALHLFSLNAFKQNQPFENYLELSKWVVDYCEGNPLALKVLGRYLHGRGKEEWESALAKLNQTPDYDILNVLKLSFDGLDDTQKNRIDVVILGCMLY
ncbi:TMV resistance protein N-like [Neltuma alba]|uniref:TMV resistance protein N-like n=1 Tax=Neltuma alba TaxID=207710 RepID=UPI0010A31A1F|nr:TMV resistance protein N-like [Prosopis alba]